MKTVRSKVFETNSSSTHSISISNDSDGILDTIVPDDNGVITLKGGEFGWEWESYNDALTKANYCAVDCHCDLLAEEMLIEVIKEHTGAKEVVLSIDTDWNSGNYAYIDHQSRGTTTELFENKKKLKNFIFNSKCWLFTGNDNSEPPCNFYDVQLGKQPKYRWELKVEGTSDSCKFLKKPTNKQIKAALYSIIERHPKSEQSYNIYPNEGFLFNKIKLFDGTSTEDWFDPKEKIIRGFRTKSVYGEKNKNGSTYRGEDLIKYIELKYSLDKL